MYRQSKAGTLSNLGLILEHITINLILIGMISQLYRMLRESQFMCIFDVFHIL